MANKQHVSFELSEQRVSQGAPYDGWDFRWLTEEWGMDPMFGGGLGFGSVQDAFNSCRHDIIDCHGQIVTIVRHREEEDN